MAECRTNFLILGTRNILPALSAQALHSEPTLPQPLRSCHRTRARLHRPGPCGRLEAHGTPTTPWKPWVWPPDKRTVPKTKHQFFHPQWFCKFGKFLNNTFLRCHISISWFWMLLPTILLWKSLSKANSSGTPKAQGLWLWPDQFET